MTRKAAFEIFERSDGLVGLRLRARNGEVQIGAEGYASRAKARRAVEQIRRNAAAADVVDLTTEAQRSKR